tara:strand:- start:37901 stop:38095 length:195 start_codon:yes stop_codon:yes gene_type:complete
MRSINQRQRLGNSIIKMRRTYGRMVIATSNFNKAKDQKNAAHCMTEANRIHRLLTSFEEAYYEN